MSEYFHSRRFVLARRDRAGAVAVGARRAVGAHFRLHHENGWYQTLALPALQPPGPVFGIAWSILYTIIAIPAAIVWGHKQAPGRTLALVLFALGFAVNLTWSPVFFRFHLITPALGIIGVMFVVALATTFAFARVSRLAAWLMVPYLVWLCFAGGLECPHHGSSIRRPTPFSKEFEMQTENKLFEDLSKVATSALGTLAGVGREVEENARRRAREFVGGSRCRRSRRVRSGQGRCRRRARSGRGAEGRNRRAACPDCHADARKGPPRPDIHSFVVLTPSRPLAELSKAPQPLHTPTSWGR